MQSLESIPDLQKLISNEVQESIHLDYKDSRAINRKKRHEISKDVSAFANSDGGILVYGITEEQHLPVAIDCGVDHASFTREWLEEVITSNVQPTIEGLSIVQIPLSSEKSVYVIRVPKSSRAPHQEQSSKRYYRRYNFKSQPMEDYEIQDIRSRTLSVFSLVNFDVIFENSNMAYFQIENTGNYAAENLKVSFTKELSWRREAPPFIEKGIRYFPAGKKIKYFYNTGPAIFSEKNKNSISFEVHLTYTHPQTGKEFEDEFYIDFNDYLNTTISEPELVTHGKVIERCLRALTGEVKRLNSHIEKISTISSPTGLDISRSSLRAIKHIVTGEGGFDKIDPNYCREDVFMEVLQISRDVANRLEEHFWNNDNTKDIEEIEGINEDMLKKFKINFIS